MITDRQKNRVRIEAHYHVECHCPCDADNPNDAAHDMIGDIKRAVFSGDTTFGGFVLGLRYVGRTITPREDGARFVAASVDIALSWVETL